jgi:GGDEF domain-containing protein
MSALLRHEDTLARLGGDEFAVVFPGDEAAASVAGLRLRAARRGVLVADAATRRRTPRSPLSSSGWWTVVRPT